MQILGLLGMYFDAVVVEVKTFLLLFNLALDILCSILVQVSGFSFVGILSCRIRVHQEGSEEKIKKCYYNFPSMSI